MHYIQTTAVSAHRHAAADNLPERREVRLDAVQPLRAVDAHAETRHDFVYNQERPMFLRFCGKRLQEFWLCRHHAHITRYRFHNHASDFIANLVKEFLHASHIVVLQCKRVLREICRNPLAARLAHREHSRARLDEQAIAMAMVTAFEFHNLVATGKTASRTNRAHRRFGATVHHANHLDARHKTHH